MSDNNAFVLCAAMVVGAILSLAMASMYYRHVERRTAMENGYIQQTLPGKEGVYWVKDGKPMSEKQP